MTNPTTPFSWQMPTSTDLVTDLPADFETFGQAVATSMADLLGGTSGQILSKASNTDMDFTWITNDVGDITAVTAGTGISGGGTSGAVTITNSMATEIAAKGDLIVGTGAATFDNLTAGANNTVLIADSTAATGLKWGGGWTTWTPAYTRLTIGNGTVTARYQQVGKTVNFFWRLVWGSTTSVTNYPVVDAPVAGFITSPEIVVGQVTLLDNSPTTYYYGTTQLVFGGNGLLLSNNYTGGNWSQQGTIDGTTPVTWTTGDVWTIQGTYEAA
jgi:hypothetical protein